MSTTSKSRNVLGLLGAFVITSMVAGVLAAGLLLPAVGASGVTASKSVDFFDSIPGDLKQPPLSQQSKVLDRNGKTIATFFDQNRVNVPLSKISQPMQEAIVAIEDSRFYKHGGVDPQGLLRAFLVNQFHSGVVQGASTLTQQYVKNVLLQAAFTKGDKAGQASATADTNSRKIQEIRYAVTLEKTMSKAQILDNYLNIAWFGGITYGVEAASLQYFGVHAQNLTVPQAALLAGMVQNAAEWSPTLHPQAAKSRRDTVLGVMRDQGYISAADFTTYQAQGLNLSVHERHSGCANTSAQFGFYCDYVETLIENDSDFSALGKTADERKNALMTGGLTIQTNLDPKIQLAATNAVKKTVPEHNSPGVGSAAVTVEPGTGKVLSIAVNRTFNPDGKGDHGTVNWATDYAYGQSGGFQTGSTFKAFTLATWLKQGKSLNATVDSSTGTSPFSAFHSCVGLDQSQSYTYSNAEGSGKGSVSVFNATAASINGAFVHMEMQLDLCDIAKTAESLGVHLAKPTNNVCDKSKELTQEIPRCLPSMTLGVFDISPMTMAAAYASFAAGGLYCKPIAISGIVDDNGKAVSVPQQSCTQALNEKVANTVTYGLSHVFLPGGTAAHVGPLPGGRAASGKTGTTNDATQTWFVGYTKQLATAVWVGEYNPGSHGLNYKKINGVRHSVFGATYAAPIWKTITIAASQGTPKLSFGKADSKLLVSPTTAVPNVYGMQVSDAIDALRKAGFNPSSDGGVIDSNYPAGTVAITSPAAGSKVSTGSNVQISISDGRGGQQAGGGGGALLNNLFPNGNG